MSVEVTRLPSGLDRRDRRHAASARPPRSASGSAAGSRDERADEHGISHLLEHMAFKGTDAPHRAPDRRGDRGGRRRPQRRDLRRDHGLLRARAQGRRAARARHALRHPRAIRPSIRTSCKREQNVILQEIGAGRGHARRSSCSIICRRPPFPTSRSAARSSARRETRALAQRRASCAPISRAIIAAPDMVVAAAGAVEHATIVDEVEQRFASFAGADARRRRSPRASAAARMSKRAISSRRISRSRFEGLPQRDPELLQPADLLQRPRRRHVVAAVPGGARDPRPLLFDLRASTWPIPTPASSAIYAGTDDDDAPELMQVVIDEIASAPPTPSPRPRSPAPRRR